MDKREIVYLMLQDKYIKMILNKNNYTSEEVGANSHNLFPLDWSFVDIENKIKYITEAIEEKKNLIYVYNQKEIEEMDQKEKLMKKLEIMKKALGSDNPSEVLKNEQDKYPGLIDKKLIEEKDKKKH